MAVTKNMSVIVVAAMFVGCATDPAVKSVAMFNGKDLTGWYTYIKGKGVGNDPDRVFKVNAEGNLLISGDGFGYIATEQEYSDYRLSLEYRWCGRAYGSKIGRAADSGLLFHAIGEDGAMNGTWMKSFEYNIIVGRTGDLIVIGEPGKDDITAKAKVNDIGRWNPDGKEKVIIGSGRVDNRFNPPNLSGDDTRPITPPESPYGEWNRLELVCRGDRAEYYLNGVKVNELYGLKPTGGEILLQTEGHGIEYRNVRMEKLPVDLLAEGLDGWESANPGKLFQWEFKDGVLENDDMTTGTKKRGANLRTKRSDFHDFLLDCEVKVPEKGNSGIYLRGRFEIQIIDSLKRQLDTHCMGVLYGLSVPKVHAEKPADEWQTLHIRLAGRHLTVVLNGITIIDDIEVPGVTKGAMDEDAEAAGPLLLQGDHSGVAFRKLVLTPLD